MPKRTPGGRVKKAPREARRAAAPRQAAELAPSQGLPAGERVEATHRARAESAAGARERAALAAPSRSSEPGAGRPSLLSGVRRPGRAGGAPLITDYGYVIDDLRRIGILAGAAFAILIALTFVIR